MRITIFLITLIFASHNSYADITNFYLVAYGGESERDYCDLRETKAGAKIEGKPLIFVGDRTDDACSVQISNEVFSKQYKYCLLSGITVTGAGSTKALSCDVSESRGAWFFEGYIYNSDASAPVARTITCNFICIGNSS